MQKNGKKRLAWVGALILAGAGVWWWRGRGAEPAGAAGYQTQALERGDYAPRRLQAGSDMVRVHLAGVRFGNLNTPADLAAAGMTPGP